MGEKPKRTDKRVSLAPLTPDEALKLALQTGPHPKEKRPTERRTHKKGQEQEESGK